MSRTRAASRSRNVAPGLIGVALAGYAVGGLVGATLVGRLHRRFRPGRLLIGVALVEAPLLFGLGVPWGPLWVAAVLLCAALGVPALQVLIDVAMIVLAGVLAVGAGCSATRRRLRDANWPPVN
ncbi:MAG TPA: hypothetical protein VH333_15855 [Pseudonocardiaceae bacterium]|jgi:predicted MFS family arabinose efflux permease|nr:hypothetical protein [Pseudonocardiaceae bacterium]